MLFVSLIKNSSITIQCKEKEYSLEEITPFSFLNNKISSGFLFQDICNFQALMVTLNLENTVTCNLFTN
jgi:hypothetical protein